MKQEQTKHTPGPWEALYSSDENGRPSFLIHANEQTPHYVASCHGWISEYGKPMGVTREHEANARLIAAAPCLLSALLEYVQRHEAEGDPSGLPEYEQAIAAIAKATGTN